MAPLTNSKQERFCLAVVDGKSDVEAYKLAGYKSRNAERNACRLRKIKEVTDRIAELQELAELETIMTVKERKQRLSEIGRARLVEFTCAGPDGDQINVGPESPNNAALCEITSRTEYDDDGSKPAVITKIKLHSPIQAIQELNKMDNAYTIPDVNVNLRIKKVTIVRAYPEPTPDTPDNEENGNQD